MSKYQRLPQSEHLSSKPDLNPKTSRGRQNGRANLPFWAYLRSKIIVTLLASAAVLVCGYAVVKLYIAPVGVESDLVNGSPLFPDTFSSDEPTPVITGWRAIPTLDPSIDTVPGVFVANVHDPEALDAQKECPGYLASNVQHDSHGFTARLKLAGKHCNVYGTDVEDLNLTVQYQSIERLSVSIIPTYLVSPEPENNHDIADSSPRTRQMLLSTLSLRNTSIVR